MLPKRPVLVVLCLDLRRRNLRVSSASSGQHVTTNEATNHNANQHSDSTRRKSGGLRSRRNGRKGTFARRTGFGFGAVAHFGTRRRSRRGRRWNPVRAILSKVRSEQQQIVSEFAEMRVRTSNKSNIHAISTLT